MKHIWTVLYNSVLIRTQMSNSNNIKSQLLQTNCAMFCITTEVL